MRREELLTDSIQIPTTRNRRLEKEVHSYLSSFYERVSMSTDASRRYPGITNLNPYLKRRSSDAVNYILRFNNELSSYYQHPDFKHELERQKKLRGSCAIRVTGCIDGRKPWAHLTGHIAGVTESMAGVPSTEIDPLTGGVYIQSETLRESTRTRPSKENAQMLEIFMAHEGCAAMQMWAKTDDPIQENLDMFNRPAEALLSHYNSAARIRKHPQLDKIGVRAVYNPDTMGLKVGYGEKSYFDTTELTKRLVTRLSAQLPKRYDDEAYSPAQLKDTFTHPFMIIKKEKMITNIVEFLMTDDEFGNEINNIRPSKELSGLTDEQIQALSFQLARIVGLQYLTGHYENTESHPFAHHEEKYQAIAIDDGPTLGQYDPVNQVFGANAATLDEGISHIVVQTRIMDNNSSPLPYHLFISTGLPQRANEDSKRQKRIKLASTYRQILRNGEIVDLIKDRHLTPIPVTIYRRSHDVDEVPNLAS